MNPSRFLLVIVLGLFGCSQAPEDAAEAPAGAGTLGEREPAETVPPAEPEPAPVGKEPASPVEPEAPPPRGFQNMPPEYLEASARFTQASRALREGDKQGAEEFLDNVLTLQPGHLQAVRMKTQLCRDAARYEEALGVLNRALEERPGDLSFLLEKTLVFYEAGNRTEALEQLHLLFEGGDPVPDARFLRAVILAEEGDSEGALAALEDAADNGFLGVERIEEEEAFAPLRDDERFRGLVANMREALEEHKSSGRGNETEAQPPLPRADRILDAQALLVDLQFMLGRGRGEEVDFEVTDTEGRTLRLEDYEGKAVLLVLWTPHPRESLPLLEDLVRLQGELGDQGLEVIALCRYLYPDPAAAREAVASYMQSFKIDLRGASIQEDDAKRLRVGAYPSTIFIGRDGKIYLRASGRFRYADLARMARVLVEAEPPEPEGGAEGEAPAVRR